MSNKTKQQCVIVNSKAQQQGVKVEHMARHENKAKTMKHKEKKL
jgi:hypothetical protein